MAIKTGPVVDTDQSCMLPMIYATLSSPKQTFDNMNFESRNQAGFGL